ncbi:MAG: hypothetical protein RL264_3114 [Bacteroidota bacterium]|jgi:uncharacterized protein (TIGR02145 family)
MRLPVCFYLLFLPFMVLAQAPNRVSYQAQVFDGENPVISTEVSLRISILQGSVSGSVVYSEIHTSTSTENGYVNIEIGGGAVVSGDFSSINWGSNSYFLKSEVDPNGSEGGLNYSLAGTQQLLSVPYAFYSNNGVPSGGTNGQILTNCNGTPMWTTDGVCPGLIVSLDCEGALNNGTLTSGVSASSVNSVISYTVGNGGTYSGQTVNSTGVIGLIATLISGTFANGDGTLTYTITGTPSASGTASFALNIGGQACTLSREVTLPVGTITSINCEGATNNGTLTSGVSASSVNSVISYTSGNGGTHSGQTVNSTGVTGLTATLSSGTFASGNGTLTYTITGTPSASGTASFAINIGGQSCTLARTVDLPVGTITTLSCGTATNNGTLTSGVSASSVNSVISYTGGNGGTHSGQTVNSTGVTGLTATLSSGTFASGDGNLTYIITGTASASGTASFALNIGGQACTLSREVTLPVGTIASINCEGATNNGTLTSGVTASSVNSVISYTSGNGGTHSGQTVNSTGVTGLTATLSSGTFASGNGTLTYTITGTPSASGTASFAINIGGQTCTLTRSVIPPAGSISSINCSSASNAGNLQKDQLASSVTSTLTYSGGIAGSHNGQTVSSTGVLGLTASLSSGDFVNGTGTLTYVISGTPSSVGIASFEINIGGQSCTLTRYVNANCGDATVINDVLSPSTNLTWMDRNIGASRVATASNDASAYGDLFQWGRAADGHQCRNSSTTATLSSSDNPGHGNFITGSATDWRSPSSNNLWQGVNGVNNPCPSGYRLPTQAEFQLEMNSWSTTFASGAFNSPLKMTVNGFRGSTGTLSAVGAAAYYWTSSFSSTVGKSNNVFFNSSNTRFNNTSRSSGLGVRCLKN